jgi:hypothetical protein
MSETSLTPFHSASFHRWFRGLSLHPTTSLRIVPAIEHGTPILINRDLPRSGYWDHPVSLVRPGDVELRLLRFFDFDQIGCRDFEYLEVVVHASSTYPEIVGRAALIEFNHAKILLSKAAA